MRNFKFAALLTIVSLCSFTTKDTKYDPYFDGEVTMQMVQTGLMPAPYNNQLINSTVQYAGNWGAGNPIIVFTISITYKLFTTTYTKDVDFRGFFYMWATYAPMDAIYQGQAVNALPPHSFIISYEYVDSRLF